MKLRNKKTGEIGELLPLRGCASGKIKEFSVEVPNGNTYHYEQLSALVFDWEDYEEPKKDQGKHWYIDNIATVEGSFVDTVEDMNMKEPEIEFIKSIGNYFETKEEAEKAVEKLKAWKRLKDNGFRFTKLDLKNNYMCYKVGMEQEIDARQVVDDLDLLFGGEDETKN